MRSFRHVYPPRLPSLSSVDEDEGNNGRMPSTKEESLYRTHRATLRKGCSKLPSTTATLLGAKHVTTSSASLELTSSPFTLHTHTTNGLPKALSISQAFKPALRWRLQCGRGGHLVAASHRLSLGANGLVVKCGGAVWLHTSPWRMEEKERSVLEKAVDTLKEKKHKKVHAVSKID